MARANLRSRLDGSRGGGGGRRRRGVGTGWLRRWSSACLTLFDRARATLEIPVVASLNGSPAVGGHMVKGREAGPDSRGQAPPPGCPILLGRSTWSEQVAAP